MKRNEVIVSGRQKDKRVLERIKESNVRLYKNGLTFIDMYSSTDSNSKLPIIDHINFDPIRLLPL